MGTQNSYCLHLSSFSRLTLLLVLILCASFCYITILGKKNSQIMLVNSNNGNFKNEVEDDISPVLFEDLNYKLPTQEGVDNEVKQTKWWKSIAYIDMDIVRRPVDYECKTVKEVGNWWICSDEKYTAQRPCLVYSFGINYDFRFDDAMAKLGCEVHSFDPSMNSADHIRKNGVHFYQLGISNESASNVVPKSLPYVTDKRKWIMMTLLDIKKKLGHQSRDLDVLKMDIESYEWDVIDNMIKDNMFRSVKQFIVEYHVMPPDMPKKDAYPNLLHIYKSVHDIGLKKFKSNYEWVVRQPSKFRYQINVGYVNPQFHVNQKI